MIKQILIPTVVTGTLLAVTSSAQAGTLILDNFSVPTSPLQFIVNTGGSGVSVDSIVSSLDQNEVLGGSRHLTLINLSNEQMGASSAGVLPNIQGNSLLVWNNDVSTKSMLSVVWNANGSGLGADLSEHNGIDLVLNSIDLNTSVQWTLVDNAGKIAEAEITGVTTGTMNFAFDDFTVEDNFNFDEVDQVSLMLDSNGLADIDASVDLVAFSMTPPTVTSQPEPNTILSILAFGVAGLLASSRKRDKS